MFVGALVRAGLVDFAILTERLPTVEVEPQVAQRIASWLRAVS